MKIFCFIQKIISLQLKKKVVEDANMLFQTDTIQKVLCDTSDSNTMVMRQRTETFTSDLDTNQRSIYISNEDAWIYLNFSKSTEYFRLYLKTWRICVVCSEVSEAQLRFQTKKKCAGKYENIKCFTLRVILHFVKPFVATRKEVRKLWKAI